MMPTLFRDIVTCSRSTSKRSATLALCRRSDDGSALRRHAVDDNPVQTWVPGDPIPTEFTEAAHDPTWTVVAHNDQFETAIEDLLLHSRFDWPHAPLERHRCTMARRSRMRCLLAWIRPPSPSAWRYVKTQMAIG